MFLCVHDWETTADEWMDDNHHLTFKFCAKCGKWKGKVKTGLSPALKNKSSQRFHALAADASHWLNK